MVKVAANKRKTTGMKGYKHLARRKDTQVVLGSSSGFLRSDRASIPKECSSFSFAICI